MRSLLSVVSALLAASTVVVASPSPLGKYINCDCSGITIPSELLIDYKNASNTLAPPAADERLMRVALGIGSQNYSCADGKPVANGALAQLFDISCLLTSSPELGNYFSPVALHTSPSFQSTLVKMFANFLSTQYSCGVHYFKGNFATPYFEFTDRKSKFCGSAAGKISASQNSDMGKAPYNFGAVPSLRLAANADMGSTYSTVYRLHTAGGQPPATCDWTGQKQIPYTAQYYFYEKKGV
ncbi:hypothetical protein Dda_5044 [Drechslerella dactyloides]|uniref:Malate dehydrogenase n=1 Tax=Drechslerella dactyloides TaxID=74499 RepID=A0AAD6NL73_DREDA|nr:hypothetical protein Dda_5044 [Drechslerella dactyloides]